MRQSDERNSVRVYGFVFLYPRKGRYKLGYSYGSESPEKVDTRESFVIPCETKLPHLVYIRLREYLSHLHERGHGKLLDHHCIHPKIISELKREVKNDNEVAKAKAILDGAIYFL